MENSVSKNEMQNIYLKDYTPPAYDILKCELIFDLFEDRAIVKNKMSIKKIKNTPLELNGEELTLESIKLDGTNFNNYIIDDKFLTIKNTPELFTLELITTIYPQENSSLDGLYKSGNIFCTQNEPEGFRRITYFLDRPDCMSIFTTTVIADKQKYPTLLSNGNLKESGDLEADRHYTIWEDPFLKPTYLFALVAGDLGSISDNFITKSKNNVELNIYCDRGNESKCTHAMSSLKASMKWDEDVYDREYDLNIFNIVAVDSFNMGAMENKGLNIFNSHYVLASSDTATDSDYLGIESVIAHEYFHNWTGNRITCRDWFQLTLKEGLTVFRDQSFSADMNSATLQRVSDARALKQRQFLEDSSPTSHPIKPESYLEINNFYTATIYEKGAEVIRMLHTILGKDNYKKAMDYYFKTFDGQAVRTEDFLNSMLEIYKFDLEHFKLWYSQERTPRLIVQESYDNSTYRLSLTQDILDRVNGEKQKHMYYPLKIALLDQSSNMIIEQTLLISKESETFEFKNINQKPVLSINREFSAPINIVFENSEDIFLMKYDSDAYVRCESATQAAIKTIKKILKDDEVDSEYMDAYGLIVNDNELDLALKAQLLELPTLTTLIQDDNNIDFEPLHNALEKLKKELAFKYEESLYKIYYKYNEASNRSINHNAIARRSLKNRALCLLMSLSNFNVINLAGAQYYDNSTMNDQVIALDLLETNVGASAQLADFYLQHKSDTLVMNKYLSVIASSQREGTLKRVIKLQDDPIYNIKVPNLVRSLVGVFARNYIHFHASDGEGYKFIADKVICLDVVNPQIAAGIAGAFKLYPRMNIHSKAMMKIELERILNTPDLSKNVYEIVQKLLG
ncbi:MAG: aminopeptidase N [Helicobacteraceae bacterium]|nr:aminopeptidase N [Helicobacteraceae bacterium]